MAYSTSSMTTPIDDEGRCPCHPFVQMSRKSPRTGEWKSMLENCPLCDIDGKSTTSGSVSPPDSVCSSKQLNEEDSKNLETRWNMNGTAVPPPFVELEVNPSAKTSSSDERPSVPPPPRRLRSRSCNSNSSRNRDNSRVRDSSRVRFQPEKDIQFTNELVRTRAKSVLRTPKYKVCEELMKQQLDESEKVTTMSMDISLGNVHDDDDDDNDDSLNQDRTKEVVQQLKDRIKEIDRAEEEDELNDLPTSFVHQVHENDNNEALRAKEQVYTEIRSTERGRDRGRRSYHQVQAAPTIPLDNSNSSRGYSQPQQQRRSFSQQQGDYIPHTSQRSSSQQQHRGRGRQEQPRESAFTPKPNMVVRVSPASNDDEVSVLSFLGGSILSVPPTRRVSALSENSDGLCLPVAEATNVLTASSISTMMTNNNEFDPKSGRCVRHPHVRLRKKKLFGRGWKVMMSACPDCCVAELCRIRSAEANKPKLVIPATNNSVIEDRSSANDGNGNYVRGRQGEPSISMMKRSSSCFTSSLRNSVQSGDGSSLRNSVLSSNCSGYAGDSSKLSMPSSKMATRMPPPPSRRSSSQDVFSRAQSLPPKKDTMSINYDEATASLTGSSSLSSNENDRTKRTYRTSVSALSQVNEEPHQEQREKRGTIHVNRMRWTDPKNGQNGHYTGKVNVRFVPHGYGSMEYDLNPKNDMSGLGVSVMIVKEGKWKEGRFRRPRGVSKFSSACSTSSSGSSSLTSQNLRSSSRSRACSTSRSQQQPRHRSSSRAAAA